MGKWSKIDSLYKTEILLNCQVQDEIIWSSQLVVLWAGLRYVKVSIGKIKSFTIKLLFKKKSLRYGHKLPKKYNFP